MASQRPVIAKINVVAKNYDATLRFYRLLGLEIPDPMEKPPGTLHSEADNPGGRDFALDNEALARIYNSGWRTEQDGCSSVVLTVSHRMTLSGVRGLRSSAIRRATMWA